MRSNYQRDYYVFLQNQQDREDELNRREEEQKQNRLRLLANGLSQSLRSLRMFEWHGFNIHTDRDDILAVWKKMIPEVWSGPQAKPLIDFLFPTSL